MQCKPLFKPFLLSLVLIFCFLLAGFPTKAQSRRVDIKEMKDTVNQLVSKIKTQEKETVPDKKIIDDTRTRLTVLLILNSNTKCGSWPPPSAKIELIEEYWKCVFDNAPYGKKFTLE